MHEYESLDGVMAHADEIKGKIGEYLRDSLEQLPLSRQLTTIKTDVALEFAPGELTPSEPDTEALREVYARIESRRLLNSLDKPAEDRKADVAEPEVAQPEGEYETVLDQVAFDAWMGPITRRGESLRSCPRGASAAGSN